MATAGRILIIPRGEFNTETTYDSLDLVFNKGKSWLAKKTVIGIEPSDENSEYWFKMSDINLKNNLETDEEGYALDASQGKALKDSINALNSNLLHYPDYTSREFLIEASGNYEETITINKDGFISAFSNNKEANNTLYLRLKINDIIVFSSFGAGAEVNYDYVYSPIYPVKAGDTVSMLAEGATNSCRLTFYNLR